MKQAECIATLFALIGAFFSSWAFYIFNHDPPAPQSDINLAIGFLIFGIIFFGIGIYAEVREKQRRKAEVHEPIRSGIETRRKEGMNKPEPPKWELPTGG